MQILELLEAKLTNIINFKEEEKIVYNIVI